MSTAQGRFFELHGARVLLRPLCAEDFEAWSEVRTRSGDWLTKWEPMPLAGYPDVARDRKAFVGRCSVRDREWQLGTGAGFGIFVQGAFAGEVNISNIQRGPFQNCDIGYWIDSSQAGNGYMPESLVVLFRFAFEELGLHRMQISVIPRNGPSNRVAQKLDLRDEGTALRYLEINGNWEDHVRYAITAEDWAEKRSWYVQNWLDDQL
jgi:ribosomal-protein-alanine N-acetyltransferase